MIIKKNLSNNRLFTYCFSFWTQNIKLTKHNALNIAKQVNHKTVKGITNLQSLGEKLWPKCNLDIKLLLSRERSDMYRTVFKYKSGPCQI